MNSHVGLGSLSFNIAREGSGQTAFKTARTSCLFRALLMSLTQRVQEPNTLGSWFQTPCPELFLGSGTSHIGDLDLLGERKQAS